MDGLIYLHNQAGIALQHLTAVNTELAAKVDQLQAELEALRQEHPDGA